MSMIFSSAYFSICPKCRGHWSIFFPNGGKSFPIGSKEMGFKAVEIFRDNGLLSIEESLIIQEQVENSPLPDEINEIDASWMLHDGEDEAPQQGHDQIPDVPVGIPRFGMMPMSMQ